MKRKIISITLYIVSVPMVLFEYFTLFWFWGGADIFNFISTPVIFVIYLIAVMHLKKKYKTKDHLAVLINILLISILPALTIVTVWVLALLLGINITIW